MLEYSAFPKPGTISRAVSWIYDPLSLPYTYANPDIEIGRHAISIDERRCAFRQNLWSNKTTANQNIEQLWFPGVHSDIGGGYPESESGLAKICLEWMIHEAAQAHLLLIDEEVHARLGYTDDRNAKPESTAMIHNSLRGWWLPLELFPRRSRDLRFDPPKVHWRIPLGHRRFLPADAILHPSTLERIKKRADYRPANVSDELIKAAGLWGQSPIV